MIDVKSPLWKSFVYCLKSFGLKFSTVLVLPFVDSQVVVFVFTFWSEYEISSPTWLKLYVLSPTVNLPPLFNASWTCFALILLFFVLNEFAICSAFPVPVLPVNLSAVFVACCFIAFAVLIAFSAVPFAPCFITAFVPLNALLKLVAPLAEATPLLHALP